MLVDKAFDIIHVFNYIISIIKLAGVSKFPLQKYYDMMSNGTYYMKHRVIYITYVPIRMIAIVTNTVTITE